MLKLETQKQKLLSAAVVVATVLASAMAKAIAMAVPTALAIAVPTAVACQRLVATGVTVAALIILDIHVMLLGVHRISFRFFLSLKLHLPPPPPDFS